MTRLKEWTKDRTPELGASFIGLFLAYGMLAAEYKENWDFRKWPELNEQRKFQEELKLENEGRNYFDKYDVDKNYILDSAEFLNYYNKEKK